MGSIRNCIFRLTALLLTAFLLFLPSDIARAADLADSLVVGIQSSKTLAVRPLLPLERDMMSVYDLVYESLITIDDDYMPQGQLAQSWEHNSSGKQWTFYLRPGVSFSDGTPLTAQDVVASARFILDLANDENIVDHGFYSNLKYFISGISAENESTVVVKTTAKRPYYGLLYAMTFPVVPASMVDSDNPPGTGPYRIGVFQAGNYMQLEANKLWWQTQPQVKYISFYFHDAQNAVMESYEYKRADAVFTRSIGGAQYKSGISSLAISYRTNQLECLLMNNTAPELTKEVRMAIRYVVDVAAIASKVYSGMVTPCNLPFWPGNWTYNDSLSSYFTKNIEEARRLIEEAGWGDSDENGVMDKLNSEGKKVNLHLRFYVYEEPENDVRVEAANMIADMLAEVGIEAKVDTLSLSEVQSKLSAGSYDLALVSYAMDVCPDPGFMLMSGNTGNYARYKSERMTRLFDTLRTRVTQSEYRQTLLEIQSVFAEDCPFICLFWRNGRVLSDYMYTTVRDVREYELLRGIESFHTNPAQ